jgi:iron complex transport system ATP-binding protein
MTTLRAIDVHVQLDRRSVLDGVSMDVPSGRWLAVIGPNGAGKSTLLRALAGLVAYSGSVLLDESDAARLRRREKSRLVAYVPQTPQLPSDMSVEQYVLLGRTAHIGYLSAPTHQDRYAASAACEHLSLGEFAGRKLGTLSGGERQRVVLARALAQQAPILLLDEPTSALDIGHQQQLFELIDDLRRTMGLTVVSTLHDLTSAGQYADALLLLHRGRVAAVGTPREVLNPELIGRVYDAQVLVTSDANGRPTVTPVRDQGAALKFVSRSASAG